MSLKLSFLFIVGLGVLSNASIAETDAKKPATAAKKDKKGNKPETKGKDKKKEKTKTDTKTKKDKGAVKKDEKEGAPKNTVENKASQHAGEASEGAVSQASQAQPQQNKLPLPRFVSLKANAVNMHVGPGKNYPIEWRYVRQNLPVEVIAEFDHWRQIRDQQGTVGWVHKVLLTGKRFCVVQGKVANLQSSSDAEGNLLATVEPGVVARVKECNATACKVDVQGLTGWVRRELLWGIYPNEQAF